MKKIVQINVSNYGSTGNIMKQLHINGIKNGFEMYSFYGRGKKDNLKNIIKFSNIFDNCIHYALSYLFDLEGFGSYVNTKKLIKKIKKIDPDVIHLHNLHGHYINIKILFEYILKHNKKVIWTLHDCWPLTGHCVHFDSIKCENWKTGCGNCKQRNDYPKTIFIDKTYKNYIKKKKLFEKLKDDNLTFVTPSIWLSKFITHSYLSKYKTVVINNDIDTEVFKPQKTNFRKKYKLEKKYVILGVASNWNEKKGLSFFLELNKNLSNKFKIILVGVNKKQIKEISKNILCFERTNNKKELAEIYSAADVFFNPTLEDNYPTVNLEAQACGTPVITFNTGGSPETIVNGFVVEKKDINSVIKLFDKTKKNINTDKIKKNNYKEYFKLYNNK